ncbi:SDR family oxidoreductase [Nocardia sp. NPDC058640]|uniref:SDR family oxidoreductase n=1 Tax=Nocardia sp. NPDC058640 TaxID=3346571 RepID=UPI0036541032
MGNLMPRWAVTAMLRPPFSARRAVSRAIGREPDRVTGKRILVTGASSGIGREAALRLADLGAEVIVVARREQELGEVRDEIVERGGRAHAIGCDLTDTTAVDALAAQVLERFGGVDVLINNAGRSIRRTVSDSCDRLHDYERTMAVNYFGPVALTLRLLPAMLEQRGGHVINVATWGVPAETMPKFAAYHASKSALSAFGRSMGAETAAQGIRVTTVHFPLVRTPMIAPTDDYRELAALTPSEAAQWLVEAVRTQPASLRPRYVGLVRAFSAVSPSFADAMVVKAT